MVINFKKYIKKYFLLVPSSILSVILFNCLFSEGTITRVDRHKIHSDPNRFPVQLYEREKTFQINLHGSSETKSEIKQIDLALGTNGENEIHAEVIFNVKEKGTFYFKGNINDNEYISLIKGPKNKDLKNNYLYVKSKALKNCALWTTSKRGKFFNDWKVKYHNMYYYPVIYFTEYPVTIYKNYEKIAYLWDITPKSLLTFVSVIIFILSLSCWKIQKGKIKYFALTIFSIMMLISFFFPPFKHADEPQHFISFLNITQQSEKISKLEHTAKKTHFTRLLFNAKEKFTSKDINEPSNEDFPKLVVSSQIETRSLITPLFWKPYAFFIKYYDITTQILLIRILNSAIFSLCILFLINKKSLNFVILICSIPTLLCVSNSISNYVFSICIILINTKLIILTLSNPSNKYKLLYLFLISLLTFETISTLFLIPFFLLFIHQSIIKNKSLIFYVITSIIIYFTIGNSFAYKVNQLYENNLHIFMLFLVIVIVASFIHEKILSIKFTCINCSNIKKNYFINYYKIIIISVVLSLFIPQINTYDIEFEKIDFAKFIGSFAGVIITWFRLYDHDFLTQTTLFTGYGWLDFEKNNQTGILNFFIFLMIPFANFKSSTKLSLRFIFLIFLYLFLSILLLISSLYIINVNPHGRYFISYFIILIFILCFLCPKIHLIRMKVSNIYKILIFNFLCFYFYSFILIFDRYY